MSDKAITFTTIDITPTWEGLLPALLAVIRGSENVEAIKNVEAEFRKMARAADLYNESVRKATGNGSGSDR